VFSVHDVPDNESVRGEIDQNLLEVQIVVGEDPRLQSAGPVLKAPSLIGLRPQAGEAEPVPRSERAESFVLKELRLDTSDPRHQ
jgi:hypothetical protein